MICRVEGSARDADHAPDAGVGLEQGDEAEPEGAVGPVTATVSTSSPVPGTDARTPADPRSHTDGQRAGRDPLEGRAEASLPDAMTQPTAWNELVGGGLGLLVAAAGWRSAGVDRPPPADTNDVANLRGS